MGTLINLIQHIIAVLLSFIFPFRTRIKPDSLSGLITERRNILPETESLFDYHTLPVKASIWALKYRGDGSTVRILATILYDHLLDKISDEILFNNFTEPVIIPLPISKERRKERGWNQSELICKELNKLEKINGYQPHFIIRTDILHKKKHTLPQTKLNRQQRLENLKGCFEVNQKTLGEIQNRNIILIDDVTTTGSTILEAKKTLLRAGASRVIAFTVAH